MNKRLIIITSTLLLVLGYAFYTSNETKDMVSDIASPVLKDLPKVVLQDLEGRDVDIYSDIDKNSYDLVVVHFWATWCAPCEAEFPALVRLAKGLDGNRIKFYFVAVNDQIKLIKKFSKKYRAFYPELTILLDNSNYFKDKFGTVRVPETYVFNKFKRAVKKFSGAMDWENNYFKRLFSDLLSIQSK